MRILLSVMAATLVVFGAARAPSDDAASHWVLQEPPAIDWRAADTLPPGAQIAVLEGDPTQEGYFTMRIKMPDGYRVPPHWHPKQERVTVLSGVLNLGTGDMFDAKKAKALQPGTYSSMPPKMTHFAWMTGETVLQLSTLGPWTINYVNAEDDPRKKRK